MSRIIRKVAVLGSGLMGSGIAAHFANTGHEVLLLDIVPFHLSEEERKNPKLRNSLVDQNLKQAVKARKLNGFYDTAFASRITTGNFDDDFEKIRECDWVIEVVVERLDIKKQVFDKVEQFRKPGALVTSNTSGIPIHLMTEGRSEDFCKNFCGTHFFNPPRYLRLLEIIPTPKTDPTVTDFLMHYGDAILGKQTVLCKDTPAFIANRVGIYAMARVFQLTTELGLTIGEVDKLTGPISGRPKTGTFRLGDLVGHDTTGHVIKGIQENCPNDEQRDIFTVPPYFQHLLDNNWLGNKSGQGFYKTVKDANGKKTYLALDLNTLEYAEAPKVRMDSIGAARGFDDLKKRINVLYDHEDKGGQFIRKSMAGLCAYVSNRIPEIADDLYSIDDAIRAGFAWQAGPFEYWDMIGIEKVKNSAEAEGLTIANWVNEMLAAGHTSFYKVENGQKLYYHIAEKAYRPIPGTEQLVILDNFRSNEPVFQNKGATLHDIGDGVLCLEFHTKMNAIGGDIIEAMNKAVDIAEGNGWKGIVIGNNSTNFSVGANLALMAMLAFQQEWDELNLATQTFQNVNMRLRYAGVPVVTATQGFVFGGGCEVAMHSDRVIAAAESYIGLVEVGVGLLPGAGGTKEFAVRTSDAFHQGDVQIPTLIDKFTTIATAKTATSASQAFNFGYLDPARDRVVPNVDRALAEAKQAVLEVADNYVPPVPRNDVMVLGRTGLAALYAAISGMQLGRYASEHDAKIAKKIAWVLCGGDLTSAQPVSEQYLLDLEREAFLSLIAEPKTMERIQFMLQNNKPLRN